MDETFSSHAMDFEMDEVRCNCGNLALLKTSMNYANPTTRYRACPRYGGAESCRFFQWIDADVPDRVANCIRDLQKRVDWHKTELQKREIVIEKKEIELEQLRLVQERLEFALINRVGWRTQLLFGLILGFLLCLIAIWIGKGFVRGDDLMLQLK